MHSRRANKTQAIQASLMHSSGNIAQILQNYAEPKPPVLSILKLLNY